MIRCRWPLSLVAMFGVALNLLITPAPPTDVYKNTAQLQVVGQVGGPTQAVAVQGSYAYVGVGLRLIVLDVADPAVPQEVGTTAPLPHFVEDVAINGMVAYVAAGGAGLRVLDVADPAHPIEMGSWDSPGYAEGVAVAGSTVYLADGPYGLRVVDVSDPSHPTEVGFAYPLNYAFEVAVAGGHAYVAAAGAGLLVADVSDPAHPIEMGAYDTPGYAYGVAVAGNTVYVADGWEGLRLVDVSNPSHPFEAGFYKTPGWAFGVAFVGNTAYVADAFGGLRVVDVSDRAHPAGLGGYEVSGGHAGSVVVAEGIAYIADRNWGLRVINVSDPAHLAQIGFYGPLGYADAVAVDGSYVYVAAGTYGLRVVDVSDSAHPAEVGAYDTGGYAVSVAVSGTYAYVATMPGGQQPDGLHVVDISDPTRPTRTGFYERQGLGAYRDLALVGSVAYLANELGLELISVTDPAHPTWLSFIDLFVWPSATDGVDVSGTVACVAQAEAGLRVVDVSDPFNPALVGEYDTSGYAEDVAVAGNKAYVADGEPGLQIVDISNPRQPTGMGVTQTPGKVMGIAVVEDMAYVAGNGGGLSLVDISDLLTPTLVEFYNTPGFARQVAVVGNYAYVADGSGGLLIFVIVSGSSTANNRSRVQPKSWLGSDEKAGRSPADAAWSSNLTEIQHTRSAIWRQQTIPTLQWYKSYQGQLSSSRYHQRTPEPGSTPQSNIILTHVASICTVTSVQDSGPGTLRRCLENAVTGDLITFDPRVFQPTNPATIALTSPLPSLTQGNLTIDASNVGAILDGSATPSGTSGLHIASSGNAIRGLQILHFPDDGIKILGTDNTIGGDRTLGSGPTGQGNVISANGSAGISIWGEGSTNNVICGNYIGTDISGTVALGNFDDGVNIVYAQRNRVGGPTAEERNLISGNGYNGIHINGAVSNTVIGNYIGTDISGMTALGNQWDGVLIAGGASYNQIGGMGAGERNIISGNGSSGVNLLGAETSGNLVVGNYVGTDPSGAVGVGNHDTGVAIQLAALNNVVERNVISSNGKVGVLVSDKGSSYNVVIGNFIGTDASGTAALGNDWQGIHVAQGASFNRIGGTTARERNIISSNDGGVTMCGDRGGTDNLIIGNFIGTDPSGTRAIGNEEGIGVILCIGIQRSFIGGVTEGERNIISGNDRGVWLGGAGIEHSFIAGNYIGTDASGKIDLGNRSSGVGIHHYSQHNAVQSNLISGNEGNGVRIDGAFNLLRANRIGTAADGASPLPNGMAGVRIEAASNTVGGPYPNDGNIVAFNNGDGVKVWTYPSNTIRRNSIYGNSSSGIHLVNGGNNLLATPIITHVLLDSVSGTACPGCIVEVFSDEEDEGQVYEGSTIADTLGAFAFSKGSPLTGPYITATATDSDGNTSEFALPVSVPAPTHTPTPTGTPTPTATYGPTPTSISTPTITPTPTNTPVVRAVFLPLISKVYSAVETPTVTPTITPGALRIRVNQSHDWVDASTSLGATVWITVTDALGRVKGTANGVALRDGGAIWGGDFDWDDNAPDIVVGDRVDGSSSDGGTATAAVITITGQVDAETNTLSGQVLGVSYPATMKGEIWEEGATWPETQTDGQGYFTLDFNPFDIQLGTDVAAWYIRPDGNWVGAIF